MLNLQQNNMYTARNDQESVLIIPNIVLETAGLTMSYIYSDKLQMAGEFFINIQNMWCNKGKYQYVLLRLKTCQSLDDTQYDQYM